MSFDGTKDIQNYNRPLNPKYKYLFHERTSADVLEENVKWLISNKGNQPADGWSKGNNYG